MEKPIDRKIVVRYAVRELMGLVVMGTALFWPAGTLGWWQGWATLGVIFVWTLATFIVIMKSKPSLLGERLGPRKGAKNWDTAILSLLGILQLGRYVVAGLDRRSGWTGEFDPWIAMIALVVCILGYALVVWATGANAFFSQVVRIQGERGHRVASGGPYQFIRHPAYAGAIAFEIAAGLLLGSWPAVVIGVATSMLIILRTALEDNTLRRELAGYAAYAERVRFRLAPGVW